MFNINSRFSIIVACILALVLAPLVALAHPAEGQTARDVSYFYDTGITSAFNWGVFTFADTQDKQPQSSLTNIEKYMIAGTEPRDGHALDPWYVQVFAIAAAYYKAFNSLPDALSPEAVKRIPGLEQISDEQLELLRNPLTGAWPNLNAQAFSPGDLYLQPLTPADMQHFAAALPNLGKVWMMGLTIDTDRAMGGANLADCFTQRCEMYTPPFYVRVYGRTGTLITDFVSMTINK